MRTSYRAACAALTLLLAGLVFTTPGPVQPTTATRPRHLPRQTARGPPQQKKEDKHQVLALVGGDVYTVSKEIIHGGTVLVKDGKILKGRPGCANS